MSKYFFKSRSIDRFWPARWSFSAVLMRTGLPRTIALIPPLGYLILWSDGLKHLVAKFSVFGEPLWFEPVQRITLLYCGALLILFAVVIYQFFAPRQVRTYASSSAYARETLSTLNRPEMNQAHSTLTPVINELGAQRDHNDGPFLGVLRGKHIAAGHARMQENEVNNVDLAAAGVAPNVSQALEAHYLLLDRQLPALSALCLSLLSIGGILFLLPSAEVALTVVARFPAIWLAS